MGTALNWLQSHVTDSRQYVKLGWPCSNTTVSCNSRVQQGSVLGPLLFAAYVPHVGDLINRSPSICGRYSAVYSKKASSMTAKDHAQFNLASQKIP